MKQREIDPKIIASLEKQSEDDAARWKEGESATDKCLREAAEWRANSDAWVERFVGPIHSKRKRAKAKGNESECY